MGSDVTEEIGEPALQLRPRPGGVARAGRSAPTGLINRAHGSTFGFSDTMSRMDFFRDWPNEIRDSLAAGTSLVTVPKNMRLANKGEPLEHFYVLVSGLVRLFIPLPNDMERVVALVGPGESLGEACLVLDEVCPYHAVAGKDSHLLAIDAHLFRRVLGRYPMLVQQVMEILARRLMENLRDTEICAQRSSVLRVACYLIQQQPSQEHETYAFMLSARKQDIAAKLGLTQETFSRMLGFLQKQGAIQVEGAQILVERASQLARMASMADGKGQCT